MCLLFPHIPDWKNTVRREQAALQFIRHKMPDSSLEIFVSTSKAVQLVRYYHSQLGQHRGYLALHQSMGHHPSRPDDLSSHHGLPRFPCFNFVISNLSLALLPISCIGRQKISLSKVYKQKILNSCQNLSYAIEHYLVCEKKVQLNGNQHLLYVYYVTDSVLNISYLQRK